MFVNQRLIKNIDINKHFLSILEYGIYVSIIIFILWYSISSFTKASDMSCPDTLTDQQCLDYLQEEARKLNDEKAQLQSEISKEQYQQLTLQQRLNYLSGQITSIEKNIQKIEVDIETKNVEIRILDHDIEKIKNNITTMQQEINTLNDIIRKRIYYSYKYTKIGLPELFLESKDLTSLLKQIKYLQEIRKNDLRQMSIMAEKKQDLRDEEEKLKEKQLEKEKSRKELDDAKKELYAQKSKLKENQDEQAKLYQISQQKEKQYAEELQKTKDKEKKITKQISDLIMALYRSGQLPANTPVKKGDIIGYEGHSGFSWGSHLHFSVFQNGYSINPFTAGYIRLSGGRIYAGPNGVSPLGDGAIMSQGFHMGYAIDLLGLYNQTNDMYYVKANTVCCHGAYAYLGCVPEGWYPLRGEGTPVRAIADGRVTRVATDPCGGKYVIVDHGNGRTSLYLHLR